MFNDSLPDGWGCLLLGNAWCIDATMGSFEPAQKTIVRALELGMKPVVFWIRRPPEDAWNNGVLKRAAHGSHATPRDIFEYTHAQVPRNLAKLREGFLPSVLPIIEIENRFETSPQNHFHPADLVKNKEKVSA